MTDPADLALGFPLGAAAERAGRDVDAEQRRAAFLRLVRSHASAAHGLARRLVGDGEAEDVVQEAFLRAWRAMGRFRGEAAPSTWLYRILVNVCRDRARRRHVPTGLGPSGDTRPDPRADGDPVREATARDLAGRVWNAVGALPPRQRECLLLRVRGGMSYREIADVLGIRPGVAKLHVALARRALIGRLGGGIES